MTTIVKFFHGLLAKLAAIPFIEKIAYLILLGFMIFVIHDNVSHTITPWKVVIITGVFIILLGYLMDRLLLYFFKRFFPSTKTKA